MRWLVSLIFALAGLAGVSIQAPPTPAVSETIRIAHLERPVRIYKDPWGVSHIYAQTQGDLFFAQGFNAARDRLFQLEMWRRRATGTWAEVLGPAALDSDLGARLLRFRGDLDAELRHYHPDGPEIVGAFVRGINAYIEQSRTDPRQLPLEFRLLGIQPGPWTPEIVVSRHNGLFRNARDEVRLAQLVERLGAERVLQLWDFWPANPALAAAPQFDPGLIRDEILDLYRASRSSPDFQPEHVTAPFRRETAEKRASFAWSPPGWEGLFESGSNNWVLSGRRTLSGRPLLANDPHRRQQIPSLRYFVHLVGPGWDVIGGGEPALPGVSIGHNRDGAWGLTIFSVDQEDLYVYQTHPDDPNRYHYRGEWVQMQTAEETIPVRGEQPRRLTSKFTQHGPVLYEDLEGHRAFALRAAWLEVGTAPYLASLRIDQARNWDEFRAACSFFLAPSENMIWADRQGNIGWQATGITPLRPNWSGLLPVPGDGRFEWAGYLPVLELPSLANPPSGQLATANQFNLPAGYPHAVGYLWSEPFRFARILEVLGSKPLMSSRDMIDLQHDEFSLPARALVPLLKGLESEDELVQRARQRLLSWDRRLSADSSAAAIYVIWQRQLEVNVWKLYLPEDLEELAGRRSQRKLIGWLTAPDSHFGSEPVESRDQLLIRSLSEAVGELSRRFESENLDDWRYGDSRLHHNRIRHPLSQAVLEPLGAKLDVGPFPRGGSGHTVNATNNRDNQTSGASFRVIIDVGDWDRSLASNHPGQAGDPDSPHYRDLADAWAKGKYFPLLYSRGQIQAVAESLTILQPE